MKGYVRLFLVGSTNRGSRQRYRCKGCLSQVNGDVVGAALVHHFHTEVGTVDHLSPGEDHLALGIKNRLVGVEAVQVEGILLMPRLAGSRRTYLPPPACRKERRREQRCSRWWQPSNRRPSAHQTSSPRGGCWWRWHTDRKNLSFGKWGCESQWSWDEC